MTELDEVFGVRQAADFMDVSLRTALRRIHSGELPARKLRGRTGSYVIRREDVQALLSKRHEDAEAALTRLKESA